MRTSVEDRLRAGQTKHAPVEADIMAHSHVVLNTPRASFGRNWRRRQRFSPGPGRRVAYKVFQTKLVLGLAKLGGGRRWGVIEFGVFPQPVRFIVVSTQAVSDSTTWAIDPCVEGRMGRIE